MMRPHTVVLAVCLVHVASLGLLRETAWGADPGGRDALVAQGRYVLGAAGGCACHTPPGSPGLNAGGQKFEGPFGVVYSPNITPDPDTGIGRWTESQIVNATRRGERPDGTRVFPIHAYTYFAHIADDDAFALAAYLKSVAPVRHALPPRQLRGPVPAIPVPTAPKVAPTGGLARGEYLVKGATHCGDCHTPRGPDGHEDLSKFLAGRRRPDGVLMPNITPHPVTGIGRWTEEQLATFLTNGIKPNGQRATSLMEVLFRGSAAGYKDLTPADALAIARYVKTVPPIDNKVGP